MVPPPAVPLPLASMSVARPKSVTFTMPFELTTTFSGFTSKWSTPASWATSSAWDTLVNTAAIMSRSMSSATSFMMLASVLPSMYSMIM